MQWSLNTYLEKTFFFFFNLEKINWEKKRDESRKRHGQLSQVCGELLLSVFPSNLSTSFADGLNSDLVALYH